MAAFDLDEAEGTPESSGNPGRSPTELETDNEKLRSTGPPITAQMLEQKSAEPGNKNPEETEIIEGDERERGTKKEMGRRRERDSAEGVCLRQRRLKERQRERQRERKRRGRRQR